jgi:hypothetical protein
LAPSENVAAKLMIATTSMEITTVEFVLINNKITTNKTIQLNWKNNLIDLRSNSKVLSIAVVHDHEADSALHLLRSTSPMTTLAAPSLYIQESLTMYMYAICGFIDSLMNKFSVKKRILFLKAEFLH